MNKLAILALLGVSSACNKRGLINTANSILRPDREYLCKFTPE